MVLSRRFADRLSLTVGSYMCIKSEVEFKSRERYRGEWEVENLPEKEKEEIRQIYNRKGFTGQLLEKVGDLITKDKKQWVDTKLLQELHIIPE